MINLDQIEEKSSLIDESLKSQLKTIFSKLEETVTIKAVIDLSEKKNQEMASFLKCIQGFDEKLNLELYAPEEKEEVSELDASLLPVTGLYKNGGYSGIAFHGVPGGKEINSFVFGIYNLSGPGQKLGWGIKKKIQQLDKKTNIKICVSLACHHCPNVVIACQHIAALNPNIEAEMIDAALYPELVKQFQIQRIPMMIVNDSQIYMGEKTMDEIISLLK